MGGISEQSQISLGFIHILKVSLSGDVSISRCEGYLRVGRFHPILPLSVTDGIHSEPVMHLCRELTDPRCGWQQVLQYRWHGPPPSCQVPRLVTRMGSDR